MLELSYFAEENKGERLF